MVAIKTFATVMSELHHKSTSHKRANAKPLTAKEQAQKS